MSRIVVEVDEEAIAGLVLHPDVQADLGERMGRVVGVAQLTAPVDTGEFRSKIHVVERPDADGARHVDAVAKHSIYVELGTRQTDRHGRLIHLPHHTLGNALDAAGGDH
ncbi:HK97 gp10 family phage protein [Streptomyces sp. SID8374]|uniref:HK97 gp10 family phage protein n=1 Tax=Streptomyces sp. SID8374 TaxID=2690354 RepID=UPI00136BB6D0|nr:HK97 gp10 family phage protein [Streptomyces sp. SID8374]MYX14388.1 HK97 gp10 family phage protein [Streptomyces sp. SID8374]